MMLTEDLLQECFEILRDTTLLEEDATEKVQELIQTRTTLRGPVLENTTLDVLWRHHQNSTPGSSPPPRHHTIVRTASPSPWQIPRVSTPSRLGSTPPITGPLFPSSLSRSPFPSPRPSPRLAYNTPMIPHSPSLQAYEPLLPGSASTSPPDESYDFNPETVDWLLAEEGSKEQEKAAALTAEMSPFDMLRAVFGEYSDGEMERALERAGYDLGAALTALSERAGNNGGHRFEERGEVLIGKSVTPTPSYARPVTPRNGVVCRFYLSTGQCLRADCRFSHDLSSTICKYWLSGSCLAGETCIFSHDPTMAAYKVTTENHIASNAQQGNGQSMLSSANATPQKLSLQDPSAFPALNSPSTEQGGYFGSGGTTPTTPRHGFRQLQISRPNSRQQIRAEPPPAVDDTEAFPSLGAAGSMKMSKKKGRGGQVVQKENSHLPGSNLARGEGGIPTGPASLADVVRMSPSPGPGGKRWGNHQASPQKPRRNQQAHSPLPQHATLAPSTPTPQAPSSPTPSNATPANPNTIPPSTTLPWHTPTHPLNKPYLSLRTLSLKHGSQRNKYLSAAAAAWSRHDAKAAKSLSLRAQAENESVRRWQREGARELERGRRSMGNGNQGEVWDLLLDISGLTPEEAGSHVVRSLCELERDAEEKRRFAYVIGAGPGRQGKGVGKGVRIALEKGGWRFREFGGGQGVVGVEIRRTGMGVSKKEEGSSGVVPVVNVEENEKAESTTGSTGDKDETSSLPDSEKLTATPEVTVKETPKKTNGSTLNGNSSPFTPATPPVSLPPRSPVVPPAVPLIIGNGKVPPRGPAKLLAKQAAGAGVAGSNGNGNVGSVGTVRILKAGDKDKDKELGTGKSVDGEVDGKDDAEVKADEEKEVEKEISEATAAEGVPV